MTHQTPEDSPGDRPAQAYFDRQINRAIYTGVAYSVAAMAILAVIIGVAFRLL